MRIAYYALRIFRSKDLTMKRFTSFKPAVFASLLLSSTLTAFASGGGSAAPRDYPLQNAYSSAGQHTASTASVAAAQGTPDATRGASAEKSRAQVREELVEPQRMGPVPSGKTDYPPSPPT